MALREHALAGLMAVVQTQVTWLVVTKRRHYTTHVIFFIVECDCDVARFLCAMRVFEVQASSLPLGYLRAKFCFFRRLQCWTSPWRKSHSPLITQSRSLFDAPGTEAFASENS